MIQRAKKQRKLDKQNILIQNLIRNSREGSKESARNKLTINLNGNSNGNSNSNGHPYANLKNVNENVKSGRNVKVTNFRYQDEDNIWDNIDSEKLELPTFGDWKNSIRVLRHSRNNTVRLNSIQLSTKPITLMTEQTLQSKPSQRLQQYQSTKLKAQQQQSQKPKLFPLAPLQPLQTIEPPSCGLAVPRRRSLVQQSLSSRARALSHQLQANYETIDSNLNKIINRKQIFKNLYIKQKSKYEDILRKHGIEEQVDDTEFEDYFKN